MTNKESKDYPSDCVLIFLHQGERYGLKPDPGILPSGGEGEILNAWKSKNIYTLCKLLFGAVPIIRPSYSGNSNLQNGTMYGVPTKVILFM